jgi:hypothetical protein
MAARNIDDAQPGMTKANLTIGIDPAVVGAAVPDSANHALDQLGICLNVPVLYRATNPTHIMD